MLHLVGDTLPRGNNGMGFSIQLADQVYWLTYQSFVLLTYLAIARKLEDDGWLKEERHPFRFSHKWHHVYRLRQELRDQGYIYEIIENDKGGQYRLTISASAIALDSTKIIDSLPVAEGTFLHKCLSRV